MANDERRYTAAEWREIQQAYAEQPRHGVRAMFPEPHDDCGLGAFSPEALLRSLASKMQPPSPPAPAGFQPRPHLEEWFASLSPADIAKLEKLLSLRAETVAWIEGKNERELKNLDGAAEFITSSRTAAKVLMLVAGTAVTFLTGTWALAKAGIDAFSLFRGGLK